MPSLEKMLKEEIQRVAQKEVSSAVKDMQKEIAQLRKQVASLSSGKVAAAPAPRGRPRKVVASQEDGAESTRATGLRPTSKTIQNLRKKLGVSQTDFAKLMHVSAQSVTYWETKGGRIALRKKTLARLQEVMTMGKREAQQAVGKKTKAKANAEAAPASPATDAGTEGQSKTTKKTTKKSANKSAKKTAQKATRKTAKKTTAKATTKKAAKRGRKARR